MVIEFELQINNSEERNLVSDFCNKLVETIQNDIMLELKISKMLVREEFLLKASWIQWYKKPRRIDMKKLTKLIVRSIEVKKRRNTYIIQINPHIRMPGSLTKLSTVARFLDRGNEMIIGTTFISRVFNKYRKRINNYWKSYVFLRTGTIPTSEVIIIR